MYLLQRRRCAAHTTAIVIVLVLRAGFQLMVRAPTRAFARATTSTSPAITVRPGRIIHFQRGAFVGNHFVTGDGQAVLCSAACIGAASRLLRDGILLCQAGLF